MTLNSRMHSIYLSIPVDAALLPELKSLSFWARTVHEVMLEVNPNLMLKLADAGNLEAFIRKKQDYLVDEAFSREKEWRLANPLSPRGGYFERTSWIRHGKIAAQEALISELVESFLDCTQYQ